MFCPVVSKPLRILKSPVYRSTRSIILKRGSIIQKNSNCILFLRLCILLTQSHIALKKYPKNNFSVKTFLSWFHRHVFIGTVSFWHDDKYSSLISQGSIIFHSSSRKAGKHEGSISKSSIFALFIFPDCFWKLKTTW